MRKIIFILVILMIVLIAAFGAHLARKYPTTSPLKSGLYFVYNLLSPHKDMKKEVLGFMPYWRIDDINYIRHDLVTDVNYFGLFVDNNGGIVKVVDGETNPGWREWNNQEIKDLIAKTQIMGGEFSLSIMAQNNETIEAILNSEKAQNNLIENILSEVHTRKLNGVNIDFEYLGEPEDELRQKFTDFSLSLKSAVADKSPQTKLYVSIMPMAARQKDLFDFRQIINVYDKFIGMSYEYAGAGSEIATATAPMTGFAENKFYFDVKTTYDDYLKVIPKEKILMGVPYYGRDWAVQSGSRIQSKTLPDSDPDSYRAVISYARAREMKEFKKSQCKFDSVAQQPWCWYTDEKTKVDHQVWFEDTKSIGLKYDFAKNQDFGGVAIWVLGYDKDYPDLWNLIKNKFSDK
jgi:spore germination protein YaaH